jgi:hypothetical protein
MFTPEALLLIYSYRGRPRGAGIRGLTGRGTTFFSFLLLAYYYHTGPEGPELEG